MPALNTADALRLGATKVDAVYAGRTPIVVPRNLLTQEQAAFTSNYRANAAQTIGCGWTLNGSGAVLVHDPATPCLRFTHNTVGGKELRLCNGTTSVDFFPATPGQTYTFLVRMRSVSTGTPMSARIHAQPQDSAGANVGSTILTPTLARPAWEWVKLTFVAPAGSFKVWLGLSAWSGLVGDTLEVSHAAFYEGDLGTWYQPADFWAPNLLTVEQADVETNTPSGPNVVAGWRTFSGTAGRTATVWVSDRASHGTHSIGGGTGTHAYHNIEPVDAAGTGSKRFPVVAGRGYSYIIHSFNPGATVTTRAVWYWDDAALVAIGGGIASGDSLVPADTWTPTWARNVAPPNAAWLRIEHRLNCGVNKPIVYHDQFAVYDGYVGTWLDPSKGPLPRP